MKKFTLIAGIAVIATVGSAFAAWTFEGQQAQTKVDGDNVGVIIDDDLVTTNMSGTLTIEHTSGDGKVKMTQSGFGEYSFILEDQTDSDKDTYTVTYVPGYGEEIEKYHYQLSFNINISYNGTIIEGYTGGKLATVNYSRGQFTTSANLSDYLSKFWTETSFGPITLDKLDSNLAEVNTIKELQEWLASFKKGTNPNTLNVIVSAGVSRFLKS